jgi:hypothetical protein
MVGRQLRAVRVAGLSAQSVDAALHLRSAWSPKPTHVLGLEQSPQVALWRSNANVNPLVLWRHDRGKSFYRKCLIEALCAAKGRR